MAEPRPPPEAGRPARSPWCPRCPWWKTDAAAAAGLALLALLARLTVAGTAGAVPKDATVYLRGARALADGDWVGGLLAPYPLGTSWVASLPAALGFDLAAGGSLAVALLSAPAAAFVFLLAREGWSRPAALAAGLLAAVAPSPARAGGLVLSQGPHLTLVAAALWAGARALRPGASPGWALGAGLSAGTAALFREEGLLAAGAVLGLLLWRTARPGAGDRRLRLAAGAALCAAGAAAAALPQVSHASSVWGDLAVSRKKRLAAVTVGERLRHESEAAARGDPGRGPGTLAAKLPGDVAETGRALGEALHPLAAAAALLGLLAGARAAGPARDARLLAAAAAGAFSAIALGLQVSLDYLSDRHLLPAAAALLPWAGAGLEGLPRLPRLARWVRPGLEGRAAAIAAVVAAAVLLAKTLIPVGERRAAERETGLALRARLAPGDLVLGNLPRLSFYAGGRGRFLPVGASPDGVLAYARGTGAVILVVDPEDTGRTHPGLVARLAPPEAEEILRSAGGGGEYRIYRVLPAG
ncbi:MAG: glycosyltransferase family 39 protein [Planctomycetales bacterium]|nr:glycosyltransferase family 39 protein [Planctomycetales bacterium]